MKAIAYVNFKKAEQLFNISCYTNNNGGACKELGQLYEYGRHGKDGKVNQNSELSRKAYQRGCEKNGRPDCCRKIGKGSSNNNTVKKGSSFSDFEKACKSGDSKACYNAYKIVKKTDVSKAFELSKKGCELGSLDSCDALGEIYYFGKGVKKDLVKSFEIYKINCDKGYLESCRNVGISYRDGEGIEQNVDKAIDILGSLCPDKYPAACESLGIIYSSEKYGVAKDILKTYDLYKIACEKAKRKSACSKIFDPEFSRIACETNNSEACLFYGNVLYGKKEHDKAIEIF